MSERPILFSAEMVRAILNGRKTQTRRNIKYTTEHRGPINPAYLEAHKNHPGWKDICPYGAPGDLLWVREAWRAPSQYDSIPPSRLPPAVDVQYIADAVAPWASRYRHTRFMPRWASRITLRITDIRVERVQDISDADAQAEGATMRPACNGFQRRYPGWSMDWSEVGQLSPYATGAKRGVKAPLTEGDVSLHNPKSAFARLWNKINGPGAWDENPWVWVISLERMKP
jgi:hypothetical protein